MTVCSSPCLFHLDWDKFLVPLCGPLEFTQNKLLVPPQNLFMPPQSRYPGAGPEKRSSKKIVRRSPLEENKKRSLQISRVKKMVLSSSRGQGNFRGLEASRPRTSKCVLKAKDVLDDSISALYAKFFETAPA